MQNITSLRRLQKVLIHRFGTRATVTVRAVWITDTAARVLQVTATRITGVRTTYLPFRVMVEVEMVEVEVETKL